MAAAHKRTQMNIAQAMQPSFRNVSLLLMKLVLIIRPLSRRNSSNSGLVEAKT